MRWCSRRSTSASTSRATGWWNRLQRLETQSLLTRDGRSLIVASLDHNQLAELYVVRAELEGLAARLAARHANRYLVQQLDLVHRTMALMATTSLAAEGRSKGAVDEHDAIVRAIEAGDGDAAFDALKSHISKAFETRLALDAQREEGFQEL